MRHAASVLLAAGLALSLTACSGAPEVLPPTATPAATASAATPTPAATATVTPTPSATTATTATPVASSPIATGTPTETPSPSPTAEAAATGTPSATTLRYGTFDATGAVATAGSYAFLADPADTTSAVSTYEALRDGTTTALLIHKSDAHGASQAALYDAVEAGDLFEWHEADDCFVRYKVTEVKPDPAGAVPRKLLAVEWITFAFTGCSGAVPASSVATVDLGELPDLGGASLTFPVRHGVFQVVPELNWKGPTHPGEPHELPEGAPAYPGPYSETADVTVARGFPYWREPVLPAGWTFGYAFTGGHHVSYGYCASYYADDGFLNVEICGEALSVTGTWGWYAVAQDDPDATTREAVGETRVISGRPAVVLYSPEGPLHHPTTNVRVRVYDPGKDSLYTVNGVDPSLLGSNVEGVIAIARSLFEGQNPP